jgi:cytidine deaminase
MTYFEITKDDTELVQLALKKLIANFDDGIYHHTVGAGLRCKNGTVYTGINCDGIHGSCAEYITVGLAISSGDREFDTIVAVHERALNQVIAPCGNCRQMLIEYSPEINVIINDDTGKLVKVSIKDLLPFAWYPVAVGE